jgi:hypothetical protein
MQLILRGGRVKQMVLLPTDIDSVRLCFIAPPNASLISDAVSYVYLSIKQRRNAIHDYHYMTYIHRHTQTLSGL